MKAGIAALWIAFAGIAVSAAFAATFLSPAEIKTTFGSGVPFTAVDTSGRSHVFTLKPDGTATQAVKGSSDVTTGAWRVNANGYCSKWGSAAEHCYTVERNGDKFDVRDTSAKIVSRWSLLP